MSTRTPPILCLVVDRDASRHPLAEAVAAAVRGGVGWVQLRERTLTTHALLRWSRELSTAAHRSAARTGRPLSILVNRRADIALALGAEGIHLGSGAMGAEDARALLDAGAEIGCSRHTVDEIADLARSAVVKGGGPTYAHLAPIWDPMSKPSTRPALGTVELARACAHGLPILAQGGVTPERCAAAISSGAAGVAVTGAILMADDPEEAAGELRRALDEAALRLS